MHTKPSPALSLTNPTTKPSCSYRLIGRNSNRMYQWLKTFNAGLTYRSPRFKIYQWLTRNRGEMAAFAQNWKRKQPHSTMERCWGIWPNIKRVVIPLRMAIKQANCRYRNKVLQFNGSGTRHMWQGLQSITDYKMKTSHVTDTDVLLPGKLNILFACFEDNTVPPKKPATKDCGPPSPFQWPTWVKHFNVLTLGRLFAQTTSLATSSEHAQSN
jgi:hypothetical protein